MITKLRVGLAGLVLLLTAGGILRAQSVPELRAPSPLIVSGSDLGFRIDQKDGKIARGTLMVRVDGRWMEAEFSPAMRTIGPTR